METCLQWEAFLKSDRMEKKHVQRLEKKHRYIMYLLKKVRAKFIQMGRKHVQVEANLCALDTASIQCHHHLLKQVGARSKGMGLKIVKFHTIVHIAKDIMNHGVPMIFDTGSNESHHKTTKALAKMTARDIKEFEKQTALQDDELHMLDLAQEEMKGRPLWDYRHGCDHDNAKLDDDSDA